MVLEIGGRDDEVRRLQVFVTHSSEDLCEVDGSRTPFSRVARQLLQDDLGLKAYIRELDPSPRVLTQTILGNLFKSDYHLVLVTPASIERQWVVFELGVGLAGLGRGLSKFPRDTIPDRMILLAESKDVVDCVPSFCRDWKYVFWGRGPKRRSEAGGRYRSGARVPGTFRNDPVRHQLGKLLLTHTFQGLNANALGHGLRDPTGTFSRHEYETWLNAFGSWSPSSLFALSRRPLKYWLKEGEKYRLRLKESISRGLAVSRLSLWSRDDDLLLRGSSKHGDLKLALWQATGRRGRPQYQCDLCVTYDLLWLFLRQCHGRSGEAYYAFPEGTVGSSDWSKHLTELLLYEDEYALFARYSRDGKRIEYSLSVRDGGSLQSSIVQILEFVRWIRDGTLDRRKRVMGCGWEPNAAGTIRQLISGLESFHGKTDCKRILSRPRGV